MEDDLANLPPHLWASFYDGYQQGLRGDLTAEGTVALAPYNAEHCTILLNQTCFGQCVSALHVRQTGPVHNLSSVAASQGFIRDKNCTCSPGFGRYMEENGTATWIIYEKHRGVKVPRILSVVALPGMGSLAVSHRDHPYLQHCVYTYDVLSGSVMGLEAEPTAWTHSSFPFPVWAGIVVAMLGVLLLAVSATLIMRRRSISTLAAQKQVGEEEGEIAEVQEPSLRDPLLA